MNSSQVFLTNMGADSFFLKDCLPSFKPYELELADFTLKH